MSVQRQVESMNWPQPKCIPAHLAVVAVIFIVLLLAALSYRAKMAMRDLAVCNMSCLLPNTLFCEEIATLPPKVIGYLTATGKYNTPIKCQKFKSAVHDNSK